MRNRSKQTRPNNASKADFTGIQEHTSEVLRALPKCREVKEALRELELHKGYILQQIEAMQREISKYDKRGFISSEYLDEKTNKATNALMHCNEYAQALIHHAKLKKRRNEEKKG